MYTTVSMLCLWWKWWLWRREAYRAARKRKRHFVSLACIHIDEMNSVPKSLSDQGHS